jgi:hypothetical protein
MNGKRINDSKTPLKWVGLPNKNRSVRRSITVSEEIAKTYVPENPSPIDESKMKTGSKEKMTNMTESRKRLSFTSENWIG